MKCVVRVNARFTNRYGLYKIAGFAQYASNDEDCIFRAAVSSDAVIACNLL